MFTQKSNYLIFSRYTVVLLLLCVLFLSNKTQAQCNIQFNNLSKPDTFCVGELIQFRDSIVSFGDIVLWNFGNGNSSTDISPVHKYSSAGTFSVTYAKSNSSGTCRDTITAFILPSPKNGVELLTPSEQCFRGNRFCFTDTIKAPDGNIIRLRHLFSDGAAYDTVFTDGKVRKAMNYTFCHTISDPTGGFYDLTVEAYDENGCISRVTFKDIIFVQPRIGAQFDNITPKPNPGCDSTIGMFENTSLLPLADVDTFYWQWGDSTSVGGNGTVNTEWWEGTNKDGKVSHHYKTHGSFDATLVVSA